MSNMKNQINVDEKLADVLREYYRCTVPTDTLNALCFSQPQLQSHNCNALEKMEGGQPCSYCNHDPLKICAYSCDSSKACLAAFAYRLGAESGKPHVAIKKILGWSYADIVRAIRAALGDRAPKDIPEAEPVEPEKPEKAPEPPSKPEKAPEVAKTTESPRETPKDLITPREAAQFWGCTAPNIYAKIKSGRITSYTKGDSPSKLVSRAEIEKIKLETKAS